MKTRDALQKLGYENTGHIHIKHCGWNNSMDKIPRVTKQDVVYKGFSNSRGRRVKQSQNQNNLSWIVGLVLKFTNPVNWPYNASKVLEKFPNCSFCFRNAVFSFCAISMTPVLRVLRKLLFNCTIVSYLPRI